MAYKVFLDVNILLDFTLKRDKYHQTRRVLEWTVKGQLLSYTTPSAIEVVSYWLTAVYGSEQARSLLLSLLMDVRVIDTGHEVALNALHSKMGRMEDALPYYTALHHKLDYFISWDRDLRAAALPALPVYSPEEFIVYNTI